MIVHFDRNADIIFVSMLVADDVTELNLMLVYKNNDLKHRLGNKFFEALCAKIQKIAAYFEYSKATLHAGNMTPNTAYQHNCFRIKLIK